MSTTIRELEPKEVWNRFADINAVPRPSKKEQKITAFMVDFGKKLGLETTSDAYGNVIIRKPATAGLENKKPIILQSHLDMVCQKNNDTVFDFDNQGIETYIDGDWVRAKGTTLGADNGMGVAAIMAILESKTIAHPALEALFTTDEETGMTGAEKLSSDALKGEILLNLDTELDTEIEIGCAGGIDVSAYYEYKEEATPSDVVAYHIVVTGLLGGHSGMEIHLGRGNANKIMNRVLFHQYEKHGLRLSHLHGGGLRNAIPREAHALVTIPEADADGLWELASDYLDIFQTEYKGIEDSVSLSLERVELPQTVVPEEIQDGVIGALDACINGVQSMLTEFPGIVESSTNMARVTIGGGLFTATFLVRSSSESRKDYVASQIESAMNLAGAEVEFAGGYNGWAPNASSAVLQTLRRAYEEVMGVSPEVTVVHAGLECGIIQGVMPDMDMISIGPDIRSPHSPDEKVHIASVARTWEVLKKGLELI